MRTWPLEAEERINLANWRKEHRKTCSYLNSEEGKVESVLAVLDDKILEKFSYQSGGGIGSRLIVKCRCGKEGDITDYPSW